MFDTGLRVDDPTALVGDLDRVYRIAGTTSASVVAFALVAGVRAFGAAPRTAPPPTTGSAVHGSAEAR